MKTLNYFPTVFIMALVLSGCEKYELDRQMRALCEKDGGSRVYERVVLPANMFDQSGYPFPGWQSRLLKGDRLSPDYLYLEEEKILKAGEPFNGSGEGRLRRVQVKIVRKSDSKVLGETVGYFRAGGDGPFWWGHPSNNSCPKVGEPIEKLVFIKK